MKKRLYFLFFFLLLIPFSKAYLFFNFTENFGPLSNPPNMYDVMISTIYSETDGDCDTYGFNVNQTWLYCPPPASSITNGNRVRNISNIKTAQQSYKNVHAPAYEFFNRYQDDGGGFHSGHNAIISFWTGELQDGILDRSYKLINTTRLSFDYYLENADTSYPIYVVLFYKDPDLTYNEWTDITNSDYAFKGCISCPSSSSY